jgi:hypothetical protein
MIFVMLSWILTSYFGRRSIYLWGSAVNTILLIALGVAASVGASNAASLAQASLGLIVSVLFTLGPAPASWVIIGETSAIRLRPLTTGMGRASYYIVEIPCIFRESNPPIRFLLQRLTYISGFVHAEPDWRKPWRQVRICMGWHWIVLLGRGILLPPGDEGTFLPRDRYHVQAQDPSSQVEANRDRRAGRRVDVIEEFGRNTPYTSYLYLKIHVLICSIEGSMQPNFDANDTKFNFNCCLIHYFQAPITIQEY